MERMKNLQHSTYAPMGRKTFITYIFHTKFSKFCKILEYKNNNYFVMDKLLKFTIKRRKIAKIVVGYRQRFFSLVSG